MSSTRLPSMSSITRSFIGVDILPSTPFKRWDGVRGTCEEWDSLQKDPELWFGDGDCLVHLYSKGQSTSGPSFNVPFSKLLKARCYPLIDRFLAAGGPQPRTVNQIDEWYHNTNSKIELYIPPPPFVDELQALRYRLSTRNFFAWLFKRSLVGEYLGDAIVGLLNSLHEFRCDGEDNHGELMKYLNSKGYLTLVDQPDHALAALYLAENFEMKELYIRSFCHCVGMSEHLNQSSDYQNISRESRRLIRNARSVMDEKLKHASELLRNFLDDELSEAHLGIASGPRAHLERFRSFLLSFYTTKLGYYPPRSSFDAKLCRRMGKDFAALYALLVDDGYTNTETMPSDAVGGICTLQLIQAFESRHDFEPLPHPLPRLPQTQNQSSSRKMGWLQRLDRIRTSQRLLAHTALLNASNWTDAIHGNELVRAYRKFEENYVVSPSKVDRQEKVSLVDARKVRWIMVYAVHQVLLSVNQIPDEVRGDGEADYHLAVPVTNLPPWQETHAMGDLLRSQTDMAMGDDTPLISWGDVDMQFPAGAIEIKPDIDYFALTHKDEPASEPATRTRRASTSVVTERRASMLSRSNSVTRVLSRSSTIRRSMRIFRPATGTPPQAAVSPSATPPMYDENVVHEYGNDTNDASVETPEQGMSLQNPSWTSRSGSTASQANSSVDSAPSSTNSWAETVDSSVKTPNSTSGYSDATPDTEMKPRRWSRSTDGPQAGTGAAGLLPLSISGSVYHRRLMSTVIESNSHSRASSHVGDEVQTSASPSISPISPLTQGFLGRHSITLPDLRRRSTIAKGNSSPVHIRGHSGDIDSDGWAFRRDSSDDWAAMQAFMDGTDVQAELDGDGVMPAWEQYADLGGLTEMT